jgi:hypothetical protein
MCTVLNRANVQLKTLPANHPTHPSWRVLTYFESQTKTNQGGFSSATRPKPRPDPVVMANPEDMDVTHLIPRFIAYKAKCTMDARYCCDKLMLQPNTRVKVLCFPYYV